MYHYLGLQLQIFSKPPKNLLSIHKRLPKLWKMRDNDLVPGCICDWDKEGLKNYVNGMEVKITIKLSKVLRTLRSKNLSEYPISQYNKVLFLYDSFLVSNNLFWGNSKITVYMVHFC